MVKSEANTHVRLLEKLTPTLACWRNWVLGFKMNAGHSSQPNLNAGLFLSNIGSTLVNEISSGSDF